MKLITKFAVFILLIEVVIFISCKKEYSCENCGDTNKPPIAIAGPDQVITLPTDSISLDGSLSSDPDGTISDYLWKKISGPASFTINSSSDAKTTVKNLTTGIYQFELKVTDNGGLSAKDIIRVIVDSVVTTNHPPVADAGPDQTITLPTRSVILDGSGSTDPDNNISGYTWTKISGPSSFNITNANFVQSQLNNLVQGTYLFELNVTDAYGLFSKDTMHVIVNAAAPPPPTSCNPGNRPLINAQLLPETTIPSGDYAGTIGNKMFFLVVECGNHCEDTVKSRAFFNIYDVGTQTWSVSSDYLMTTRVMGTWVAAGNMMIYAGGYNTDGTTYSSAISDVDIYDVSTNTWSATSLSARKYSMASAVINNKVFFAGGYYEEDPRNYLVSNKVEIYDLSTNSWSITTLSEARVYVSAVTTGNKIYFAGGINGSNATTKRVDVYDNTTNSWSTFNLQEPKAAMSSIIVGNKIYWAGGVNENRHDNNNYYWIWTPNVEIKDINTGISIATCLFQPNLWLWNNAAVQKNDKIVFFTGSDMNAVQNKFDIYDISTNSWSIGLLPQNIVGAIISINNTIYVSGGSQIWKLEF